MTIRHPLHGVGIQVWQSADADVAEGRKWIAMFSEYKHLPIYFSGSTREAAYQAALRFQNDAIEKHEFAYIARKKAAENARRKRAA